MNKGIPGRRKGKTWTTRASQAGGIERGSQLKIERATQTVSGRGDAEGTGRKQFYGEKRREGRTAADSKL